VRHVVPLGIASSPTASDIEAELERIHHKLQPVEIVAVSTSAG
jgi:hypothetical protein